MATRRDSHDGTLYQLPDGRWQARTPRRAGGPPVRTKTTKVKRDAAAWLKQQLAGDRFAELHPDLIPTSEPTAPPSGPTVAALLDEYVRRHTGRLADTTQEHNRYTLARAKRYLGNVTITELDAERYEQIEDRMVADGLGWSSIKQVRTMVNQAWRKRRVRQTNPVAGLDRPPDVESKRFDKIALTAAQRTTLVDAFAEHRMRTAVILQAYLGLRPGEVLGLCWDCVDLDSPTPTVQISRQVVTIKNRPTLVGRTKTAMSERTLLLGPNLVAALRVHRDIQQPEDDDLLFPTRDGLPTGQRNWADQLERVLTTVDLPRITPHELRHTAIELMLASGMSPHEVADVVGHATDELVQTTYRHRGQVVHASGRAPDIG